MLLREIHLTNVGLYRGTQTVRLSTDQRRPITLVGGHNGSGKTTLLNAVPLALYGIRARHVIGASSYARHLDGLVHDGVDQASVTLVFDRQVDGHPRTYIVDRSWRRAGHDAARDSLKVMLGGQRRPDLEANWPGYVDRILPLSISGLAFFDGEKIEALADVDGAADVLRTSLYGLLGLDLVEQLESDLPQFRRRQTRSDAGTGALLTKLTSAENALHAARELADRLQANRDEATRELAASRQGLAEAEDRLAAAGGELFARRHELHERRADLAERRNSLVRQLSDLARGDLPLLLVQRLVERVADVGRDAAAATESRVLVRHLKERDARMVAALDADGGLPTEHVALVARLFDQDRETYERDEIVGFEVSPGAGSVAGTMADTGFASLREATIQLLEELGSVDEENASLRATLDRMPDEDATGQLVGAVARTEAEVATAEAAATRAEDELARGLRQVEQCRACAEEASNEIVVADGAAADTKRIAREVDRAQATLELFRARIVAKNVDRIRAEVLDAFRSLIRKEGLVTDLSIDPATLRLGLVGGDGSDLDPTRLSAGERQTLATALLWGLSRSTRRTLPTIIDTPVGRLDSSHRKKLVSRYFPNASRQVVLLSTDEEVVGEYHGAIAKKVGAEYLLDYDSDTNATTVREGYFQ